jgi:Transposase, Mutator family
VSQADQEVIKACYWQLFDDLHADPGQPAVAEARRRAEAFAARWSARYPSAVAWVLDTLPELTHHAPALPMRALGQDPPLQLIQRTFGETRRRVKVIVRLPGERSCLSLVWAVLDQASRAAGAAWSSGPPTCGCSSSCAASCSTHLHSSAREVMRWLSPSSPPRKLRHAEPTPGHFSTNAGTPPG